MPRRGENIYKRKDGRWEGRILLGPALGKKTPYAYVYASTYRGVKEKMVRRRDLIRTSLLKILPLSGQEAAERWLEQKRHEVKWSTYVNYERLIERHILPTFGQRPVSDIDEREIRRFIDALISHGRLDHKGGLAPKTVSDILIVLKAILRTAGETGAGITVRTERIRVRRAQPEMRVLSVQEQNRLVKYLQDSRDPRHLGVMLSLYTGMRLGEVCALRWRDVDLAARVVNVRGTMQRIRNPNPDGTRTIVTITDPKSTRSQRCIPLPDFLIDALREAKQGADAFLLTGSDSRYVEPRSMENFFRRCVTQCGIEAANYHALRHSFATRCVAAGVDVKSLSEILGHCHVNITLERYVHSSFEEKRKSMDKLTLWAGE